MLKGQRLLTLFLLPLLFLVLHGGGLGLAGGGAHGLEEGLQLVLVSLRLRAAVHVLRLAVGLLDGVGLAVGGGADAGALVVELAGAGVVALVAGTSIRIVVARLGRHLGRMLSSDSRGLLGGCLLAGVGRG